MIIEYYRKRKKPEHYQVFCKEQAIRLIQYAIKTGGWIRLETPSEVEILKSILHDLPPHLARDVKQEIEFFEVLLLHESNSQFVNRNR